MSTDIVSGGDQRWGYWRSSFRWFLRNENILFAKYLLDSLNHMHIWPMSRSWAAATPVKYTRDIQRVTAHVLALPGPLSPYCQFDD